MRAKTTRCGAILMAAALAAMAPPAARGAELTPDQVESTLAAMHPDYARYIHEVRYGRGRLHPASHYAALVRRGGADPVDPEDGPRAGRGAVNDLVIYADTFEPWRSVAWRRMVIDHEYFHARHLAKGYDLPLVGFGRPDIDSDYLEAMAWGHVLAEARGGVYGELSDRERAEALSRYRDHYQRFHRFVMREQPSAWAHYGRFLPEPPVELTSAGSAPPEALPPGAAAATR